MGIKIYCGDSQNKKHEWEQFIEIYQHLNEKYDKNKPLYLLYNFELENGTQIDFLILQETGISILELKSYKGIIIGNEDETKEWFVKNIEEEYKPLKNLYTQIKNQRDSFIDFFKDFCKKNLIKIKPKNIGKIDAWVYFKKGSEYDNSQLADKYKIWFDVITIDSLLRKLRYVDAGTKFSVDILDKVVESLNVEKCPNDDLRLTLAVDYDKMKLDWKPILIELANTYLTDFKEKMLFQGEIGEDWIIKLKARTNDKLEIIRRAENLQSYSKLLIITGVSGSGKTVYLHQIYENFLQHLNINNTRNLSKNKIPIIVSLKEIDVYNKNEQILLRYRTHEIPILNEKTNDEEIMLGITKLLIYAFFESFKIKEEITKNKDTFLVLIKKLIEENCFIFCLDGYDETIKKTTIDNWFNYLIKREMSFIITTRPFDLVKLETILESVDDMKIYWLLLPEKHEVNNYIRQREETLGIKIKDKNFTNLNPLQLFIRSLFSLQLGKLTSIQEYQILIYGIILWEIYKEKKDVFRKIKSTNKLTRFLKSEKIERNNKAVSLYHLINGPIPYIWIKNDNLQNASLIEICGEFAYKSYIGKYDTNYLEGLYQENQFISIFVDIEQLPFIFQSRIRFKIFQLRDFFTAQYIFLKYKEGNMIPLINSDIMNLFKELLDTEKLGLERKLKKKFGSNSNEIIVNYLLNKMMVLKPTEFVKEPDVGDTYVTMGRYSLGVPNWYKILIEGILAEIVQEQDYRQKSRLIDGLMVIIKQIPEISTSTVYDTIIKDVDFGGYTTSISPQKYLEVIRKMFPMFEKPLVKHIHDLFDELNDIPEKDICKACEIEKKEDERIQNNKGFTYDEDDDEEDDFADLIEYCSFTYKLKHEIDGNPKQVYYLNLLESDLNVKIKDWLIFAKEDLLSSFQGLLRHRSDFTNEDYLQYLSYRLIDIAKTKHLAKYAISMWASLLEGEFMGIEVGIVPGPDVISDYVVNAIKSLAKKEVIWSDLIKILESWI